MIFHEMHYFKQQRQSEGWKGDFYIFEKKKFLDNYYIPNKNNIPKTFKEGVSFFKQGLLTYIVKKNTQKVFQTKFMDIETENSIEIEINNTSTKNVSKTTLIENNFEKFLKNRRDNNNEEIRKFSSFIEKDENLLHVIAYFALQSARSPLNLYGWFDIFTSENNFQKTKKYALEFRHYYNQQYLKKFKEIYTYFMHHKNDILFVCTKIESTNPSLKGLVMLSEINTINLLQYKKISPFLSNYPDNFLKNIDITVVSNDTLYFCIKVPTVGRDTFFTHLKYILKNYNDFPLTLVESPRNSLFYDPVMKDVQQTWNNFSLYQGYQYIISSYQDEAVNFIAEQLFYFHQNNELEEQYKINEHINQLLELENILKS